MAVVFVPGQVIARGDLDIFLKNAQGNPANAADIYFALFYVDPGPPETEVLVGAAQRIPVNPQVGEYYASLMVPTGASVGTYRIRWTFKELSTSPWQQVVQEFAVVTTTAVVTPGYSTAETQMIWSLRVLLRDQCVGGEEEIEIDAGGERMVVRLDDLWGALSDLPPSGQ
mgnify:CR=1 FL=1